MIREGFSPKTVSQIMGPINLNVTLGIYNHPDIQDFRAPLREMASQLLSDVTKLALIRCRID